LTALIRHWRILLLGLLVSAAALYFVLGQIDASALGRALAQAQYAYLIPASALIVFGLGARAARWRALLDDRLPLNRSFSIVNVTYILNGLLPFRLGELGRAYLASRSQPPIPVFTSLSTIVVERLMDALAVLVIIGLALPVAPLPPEIRTAAFAFLPLVVFGFAVLIVLAARPNATMRLAERLIPARVRQRWAVTEWMRAFLNGLLPLTRPSSLFRLVFWTAIAWTFSIFSGYVLMIAFFGEGNLAATFLFTAAASFAVAVPAVPGNVGPYEASIILALQAMGYAGPYETAVAFAIVVHGLNLGVVAVLGVIGFVQEGISLEQFSQGVRGMRQQENAAS